MKQSQKGYKVSGSLCLSSFIKVELQIVVVIGQRPHRRRSPLVHRRAGRGLEPAGRALEPAGRALEPAGRISEQAKRAIELVGRVSEHARRAIKPSWRALEPA